MVWRQLPGVGFVFEVRFAFGAAARFAALAFFATLLVLSRWALSLIGRALNFCLNFYHRAMAREHLPKGQDQTVLHTRIRDSRPSKRNLGGLSSGKLTSKEPESFTPSCRMMRMPDVM